MADIDKLIGTPFSNIVNWLWVEWEKWSPDPTKKETNPFNDLGTSVGDPKEKLRERPHIDHENLQEVIVGLVSTVNLIIDEVSKIPELEEQVLALEEQVISLESALGSHESLMGTAGGHMSGGAGGGGTDTGGGRRGGLIRNLQVGGKTRPKPFRKSKATQVGSCTEEREMLQSLGGLSLQQMLDRLNGYLSNHKPCINIPVSNGGRECTCGDVNGDGDLDVLDVVSMITLILGGPTTYNRCADVNGDGAVDVLDIIGLIQVILGTGSLSCPDEPDETEPCLGIIGCEDTGCHEGIYVVENLPTVARWDAAGICGGGVYTQYPVCQTIIQSECSPDTGDTDITYKTSETMTTENGNTVHISVPDDGTHCMWTLDSGCVPTSSGRKGGKLKKGGGVSEKEQLIQDILKLQ